MYLGYSLIFASPSYQNNLFSHYWFRHKRVIHDPNIPWYVDFSLCFWAARLGDKMSMLLGVWQSVAYSDAAELLQCQWNTSRLGGSLWDNPSVTGGLSEKGQSRAYSMTYLFWTCFWTKFRVPYFFSIIVTMKLPLIWQHVVMGLWH